MTESGGWLHLAAVIAVFLGVWLILRYLFPIFLPFLLGFCLAVLSEIPVKFLQKKLHFGRSAASFAGVTATLTALIGTVSALAAVLFRETTSLAKGLSGAAAQITAGVSGVRDWALELTSHAPQELAQPLEQSVRTLFSSGGSLLSRGADAALDLAGHAAEGLPGLLLLLGTAVLSGYMISAQLPALQHRLTAQPAWQNRWHPALLRMKNAAFSWLKAQVKLSGVTFLIVLAGYWLLRVKSLVPMAVLTALVDAVPLLGTGTVLLPWALVSLLSGEPVRAVGLLGVYVTAVVTRSALEPRLVGRQLGLNPLTALISLYAGYRIWGFGGMILAPILTVTAREMLRGSNL